MIDYLASMTVGEILPVLANRATAFSTSWTAWHWGCTCKHDTVILLRYKKTSGASQQNKTARFSLTTEINGDLI